MIWDETADPAVIVMLTQTHESGREKCFQYFPDSLEDPVLLINEEDEFEDDFQATLTLKSITEVDEVRSTVREIELRTKDGRTKTVWHLLFSVWPDFLVPEGDDRAALLRLIRLSQEKSKHQEAPRIVHCSAGVGRSGTFIALDWLIAELDAGTFDNVQNDDDPIADLVDRLRQQRMMMVQGDQQFLFIYDTMRELWLRRWKQRTATH
jgi:protein-tyrosine phosphatase